MNSLRAAELARRAALEGKSDAEVGRAFRRGLAQRDNPCGASAALARVRYVETHWGLAGKDVAPTPIECADPTCGVLTLLGSLREIVYFTEKRNDGGPAEYAHKFNRPHPELLYSSGGLVIGGGGYKVGIRGIVG